MTSGRIRLDWKQFSETAEKAFKVCETISIGGTMISGRIRLDWKQFSETAEKAFKDAALSGDFSDVTLAGDDGQFVEAHRLVLSSASTVLRMILLKIPYKSHPFLYMKGMSIKDISLLLKFVYTGEVTLEKESLDNFLENANELQIAGLVKTATRGNIVESCFPPIEGEIKSDFWRPTAQTQK